MNRLYKLFYICRGKEFFEKWLLQLLLMVSWLIGYNHDTIYKNISGCSTTSRPNKSLALAYYRCSKKNIYLCMKKTSRAYKIKKKLRQKEIKNRTKRVSSKKQVLHYSFFDVQQKTLKRVQCNNLVFLSIYP